MSPVSGNMLKMPFNVIISLSMKAMTVGCVVHKFSLNLCERLFNLCKNLLLVEKIVKITTILSGLV